MLVLLSNRRHITSSSSQLTNQVGDCVGVANRSRELMHDVALGKKTICFSTSDYRIRRQC